MYEGMYEGISRELISEVHGLCGMNSRPFNCVMQKLSAMTADELAEFTAEYLVYRHAMQMYQVSDDMTWRDARTIETWYLKDFILAPFQLVYWEDDPELDLSDVFVGDDRLVKFEERHLDLDQPDSAAIKTAYDDLNALFGIQDDEDERKSYERAKDRFLKHREYVDGGHAAALEDGWL